MNLLPSRDTRSRRARRFRHTGVLLTSLALDVLSASLTPSTERAVANTAPAATWSAIAAQPLHSWYGPGGALFAPHGDGLLWIQPTASNLRPAAGFANAIRVRPISATGVLGSPFRLHADPPEIPTNPLAGSHALLPTLIRRPTAAISIHELSASGRLTRPQRIAAPHLSSFPRLCSAANGDAVLVWSESRLHHSSTLAMARRPALGRVSTRVALTTTTPYAWTCAVGPGGRWVVVAAVRRHGPDGEQVLRAWTGVVGSDARHEIDLAPAPYLTEPKAAFDGAGRAYVIWRSQLPGSDFYDTSSYADFWVRSSTIAPDGTTTTPGQLLLTGKGHGGYPTLAASPLTGAVIELTGQEFVDSGDDPGPAVAFSTAPADGTFGPLVPGPGKLTPRGPLTYMPDGTAIDTLFDSAVSLKKQQLFALTISPDGSLGPPEPTGLPASGDVFFGPTPSGQPRLFSLIARSHDSSLLSTTRLVPPVRLPTLDGGCVSRVGVPTRLARCIWRRRSQPSVTSSPASGPTSRAPSSRRARH